MNPFDRHDIDPLDGPEAITERFRELMEDADEGEREKLRAEWEELITHPRKRLRAALRAVPLLREARGARGSPPPLPRRRGPAELDPPLTMDDLALPPSCAAALGGEERASSAEGAPRALLPIDQDPNMLEET